jgi:threonine/homoserine/homoserine lactone efflux protein
VVEDKIVAGGTPAKPATLVRRSNDQGLTLDTTLLAFAGISLLLAVTPGPDMAVVTKNALAHGRRGVILTTTGIALALSIWVTATAVGLSAVVRASSELLFVLKLVGAAYLAYLGIRTLIDSRRRPDDLLAGAPNPTAPAQMIFRQGFLSALSNPKLGVFFVTFLPQFVTPGQALLPRLLLLGLIFAVIGWTWMNVYGFLVTRLRDFITAPRVRQWMERVTGVVLLGFGARLAAERL